MNHILYLCLMFNMLWNHILCLRLVFKLIFFLFLFELMLDKDNRSIWCNLLWKSYTMFVFNVKVETFFLFYLSWCFIRIINQYGVICYVNHILRLCLVFNLRCFFLFLFRLMLHKDNRLIWCNLPCKSYIMFGCNYQL